MKQLTPSLLSFALLFSFLHPLRAETPEEGVVRIDEGWKAASNKEAFGEKYWLLSKEIAQKHGVAVIKAVMQRSPLWQGEEGMIYAPLIALLPREEAIKELKAYKSSPNEKERIWAEEFLTEFEMPDTEEAVKKYNTPSSSAEDQPAPQ